MMKETDVVFMGGVKDPTLYDTYGATWVAWGTGWVWPPKNALKEMHARDIHSTGSLWCLTAGAKLLHEDPVLRKAVTRDIEGKPIKVPLHPSRPEASARPRLAGRPPPRSGGFRFPLRRGVPPQQPYE